MVWIERLVNLVRSAVVTFKSCWGRAAKNGIGMQELHPYQTNLAEKKDAGSGCDDVSLHAGKVGT